MRIRRAALVAGAIALATSTMVAGTGAASSTAPDSKPSLQRRTPIARTTAIKPGQRDDAVRVIVRLRTEPARVVAARAATRGRPMSFAAISAANAGAERSLAIAAAGTRRLGGTITADYGTVINGFAATVKRGDLAAVRALPDVAAVDSVRKVTRSNSTSNAFTNSDASWEAYGVTGRGQTIAVIDTGLDYLHADFGGIGDPDAFANNDGTIIEPGTFPTAKVVGGYDFVGDDYDADTPVPDPDPLDCDGHGTHVSGTAAGLGVRADGRAYRGPYTRSAVASAGLKVGPGSAPRANLLAYRVFGCGGSANTDVIVDAIDQAVADGATVINMSLGSTWGRADDADAIAADNAMRAGVMVVMAAGNEGHAAYQVGGPSSSKLGLSVAAVDAVPEFPGARIDPGGADVVAISANDGPLPVSAPIHVVGDGDGGISLGCTPEEFDEGTDGAIAVVVRGVCARVDKLLAGQAAGAVGVVMINNAEGLPPFEGNVPGATIPFVGVDLLDGDAIVALDGEDIAVESAGIIDNPGFRLPAEFTSAGPRSGDSGHKPDVAAPGVSVASAGVGTGNESVNISGTSMASPHTAGVAALVRQAHPNWTPDLVKAALVNTARRRNLAEFDTRVVGNGVVDAFAAIRTRQLLTAGRGDQAVNFYLRELEGALDRTQRVRVFNGSNETRTYNLGSRFVGPGLGADVTVTPERVTIAGRGHAFVDVRITLSEAEAAALPIDYDGGVTVIRGRINAIAEGRGERLTIPFLVVPRPRSDISARAAAPSAAGDIDAIELENDGFIDGTADLYSWLLRDGPDPGNRADVRALGVQSFDDESVPDDKVVVLAFSTFSRHSNPAENQYEADFDTDDDGEVDRYVWIVDEGLAFAGDPSGLPVTIVLDADFNVVNVYDVFAPTDGSTMLSLFLASDINLTPENPQGVFFGYTLNNGEAAEFDDLQGIATLNPWDLQTSNGDFELLAPGEDATIPVTSRDATSSEVPALGWMVVNADDHAGRPQAELISR